MRNKKLQQLCQMAILIAISLVLVYFIHFPIFPAAAFLEYDMADVPILIGTFMFGPAAGLALTAIVSVLQWLLVSPGGGWVGALMHFLATGAVVLVTGLIYRRFHTLKGALMALVCGVITQVAVMIPLNLIFTVHFYGTPKEVVEALLLPAIIPFNAIKAGLNGTLTFLTYKAFSRHLFNWDRKPASPASITGAKDSEPTDSGTDSD